VLVVMFMRPPRADAPAIPPTPLLTRAVLAVTVGAILVLGVYPNWVQRVAAKGWPRVEEASVIELNRSLTLQR